MIVNFLYFLKKLLTYTFEGCIFKPSKVPVRLFLLHRNNQRHFFIIFRKKEKTMLRQLWLTRQSNIAGTYRTDMFSSLCAFSDYDLVIAITEPKHELQENKASGGRLRC